MNFEKTLIFQLFIDIKWLQMIIRHKESSILIGIFLRKPRKFHFFQQLVWFVWLCSNVQTVERRNFIENYKFSKKNNYLPTRRKIGKYFFLPNVLDLIHLLKQSFCPDSNLRVKTLYEPVKWDLFTSLLAIVSEYILQTYLRAALKKYISYCED